MTKKLILSFLVALLGLGAATGLQAQQLKIGTVDMKKIFENYYKTKDAEQRINEARNAAKKELEDRMETYKKATDEITKLNDEVNRPELSKENKDSKSKTRDEKLAELRTMEREIREFQTQRDKQLQDQSMRMRQGLVEEIDKVVKDRVKSEQYDLVFDRSGPSLNGVPVTVFAADKFDFTDAVVKELNKNKGSEPAPAAASASTGAAASAEPAATPAKAKKK